MVHTILKVTVLSLVVTLLVCTGTAYAWFHHPAEQESSPAFDGARIHKSPFGRYAILPNRGTMEGELQGWDFSGDGTRVKTGELNIDIPFNLLKKMVVNTEAFLDRQIAANLKVKNILEEYLAAKKRNAELLKDLSIPYLERNDTIKKKISPQVAEALEPAHEIRKKLADVILFQKEGKEKLVVQKSLDFQEAWYGEKKEDLDALPNGEQLSSASENGYAKKSQRAGRYATNYGHETELPWIFAFGLKLLRYVIENRIAIFAWAAVMVIAGLIGMLVVTR
ncbi:MAG: hypothetical protein HUN04_13920 [Desulfobacter sp.]|nr:MAG: hypothetical protein HUN04_13920 [Desulfobacter sp.]